MKKQKIWMPLVLTTALLLGACGSEAGENTEVQSTGDQEPVTISYGLWGTEERQAYTMEQIAAFEEKYPYITVEVNYTDWGQINSEIDDIMAEGRESDVMQINYNWLAKYSPDGEGFYDLNQLANLIELDAYSDLSLSHGRIDGKQNALTIAVNTSVPVYNKTLYDYYGLEVPETIEDLYAAAAVMKEDNVYQLGMDDKQMILFLCGCYENAYGVSVVDEAGNLNLTDEGYTYLAETYKDLLDQAILCPRDQFSEERIAGKRVAGAVCWLNSIDIYQEDISQVGDQPEVGNFFWTDTEERLGNYFKPSTMLAISKHTEHPQEAAMLLDFLLNDQEAVTLQGVEKGVPDSRRAQQILMEEGNLNNDVYYTTLRLNYYMEYMHILPESLEDSDWITAMLDAMDRYVDGSQTLEETLAALKDIQ